ncbi:hypothetical protein [Smaragdicoccus niigatensis]|uniref:hypothetical protein n=1 Tax=Smaragdicoccus niigatensis TaxID=359359 RepID=UPI0012DDDDD6|nr:hypothetical protein [Smaragdicoccus niigatensis]
MPSDTTNTSPAQRPASEESLIGASWGILVCLAGLRLAILWARATEGLWMVLCTGLALLLAAAAIGFAADFITAVRRCRARRRVTNHS